MIARLPLGAQLIQARLRTIFIDFELESGPTCSKRNNDREKNGAVFR